MGLSNKFGTLKNLLGLLVNGSFRFGSYWLILINENRAECHIPALLYNRLLRYPFTLLSKQALKESAGRNESIWREYTCQASVGAPSMVSRQDKNPLYILPIFISSAVKSTLNAPLYLHFSPLFLFLCKYSAMSSSDSLKSTPLKPKASLSLTSKSPVSKTPEKQSSQLPNRAHNRGIALSIKEIRQVAQSRPKPPTDQIKSARKQILSWPNESPPPRTSSGRPDKLPEK